MEEVNVIIIRTNQFALITSAKVVTFSSALVS